ncbi:MAG: hypothetical protein K2X87_33800 [Gemmataceae bacterium]|nr:hypothetical protein [Gemmataceae bacterium]
MSCRPLLALVVAAGPPAVAPPPRPAPKVADLKAGLTAALGSDFEYLGGELGRCKTSIGTWAAERFWYAKVRPTRAGRYAIGYETGFDFLFPPGDPRAGGWLRPTRAVYVLPIAVGKEGEPRMVGRGGAAYPHANVGDTLLIPVHVDWHRVGHTFRAIDPADREVASYFSVYGEPVHDGYLKLGTDPSPVTNRAAGKVKLLAGWGTSIGNRPGTHTAHHLSAYREFTAPGEYALGGRLADAKEAEEVASFRVVAKDRPVTVVLEHVYYTERTVRFRSSGTSHVGGGTPEVRVGDRMVFGAGGYGTGGLDHPKEYRPGVVEERPFRAAAHYTPEPGR